MNSVSTDHHSPPPDEKPGLYVHVPFCERKCPYCAFFSVPKPALIPDYLDALSLEAELYREGWPDEFDTLYLGGGCPSMLNADELAWLVDTLRRRFAFSEGAEMTVEANPEHLSPPKLAVMGHLGVNRLSLGAQSLDPGDLDWLGRRHTPEQVVQAVEAAREQGLADVGLDLIYGLPGRSADHWRRVMDAAVALAPTHISAYQLTIEPRTVLQRRHRQGRVRLPADGDAADLFRLTHDHLAAAGFEHYEISSFAVRGFRSSHNQKYWRRAPYLGLGPAAHSYVAGRRWWNFSSLKKYLAALRAGDRPVGEAETLTPAQARLETLMLGLRTSDGIDLLAWRRDFGRDLLADAHPAVARLMEDGLLRLEGGRLKPTPRGMLLADQLPDRLDPGPG
ncbi:MAG: radical SAM family heme chaperone HemW [Proteobacteria bacterium]|nr:radical SAM family heme chaperone HemW [Pseudomonadota bacterium]MBU1741489.1 radical SAM family heme chaperone HemW [Pseudomonadota bacterium]